MEFTIDELLTGYQKREFTPYEITTTYFERIKERDVLLNSYITLLEERALKQADEMSHRDRENMDLFGIPISFKDAIDVKDVPTTNGSIIDEQNIAKRNAEVVDTLEAAGCITLGKNNMSEYSADVTSTNKHFGDVVNPINKNRTAGGSSSGSAVSVSSNLCVASIGTDTSGSIRIPAACCGVVGIKPTFGLVRMKGITPLSPTLDHIGVIAKNMDDTKYITETLAGVKYRNHENMKTLNDIRIGLPTTYFNEFNDTTNEKMIEQVIKNLEKLGATIRKIDVSFLNNDLVRLARTIGTSEMTVVHHEKYTQHKQNYSKELIQTFKRGNNILAFEYLNALKIRKKWKQKMVHLFNDVDILITPTMPILPPLIDENQITYGNGESAGDYIVRYTQPFNLTGHPALTMPSGMIEEGIPIGFQMVTSYYQEELLFQIGKIYEQFLA